MRHATDPDVGASNILGYTGSQYGHYTRLERQAAAGLRNLQNPQLGTGRPTSLRFNVQGGARRRRKSKSKKSKARSRRSRSRRSRRSRRKSPVRRTRLRGGDDGPWWGTGMNYMDIIHKSLELREQNPTARCDFFNNPFCPKSPTGKHDWRKVPKQYSVACANGCGCYEDTNN